jgi:hypothetical protein
LYQLPWHCRLSSKVAWLSTLGIGGWDISIIGESFSLGKVTVNPVGVFGCIVTVGLFNYELRGIQRCNALIMIGTKLKRNWVFQDSSDFDLVQSMEKLAPPLLRKSFTRPYLLHGYLSPSWFIPDWDVMIIATVVFIGGVRGSVNLHLKFTWGELKTRAYKLGEIFCINI